MPHAAPGAPLGDSEGHLSYSRPEDHMLQGKGLGISIGFQPTLGTTKKPEVLSALAEEQKFPFEAKFP